MALYDRDEVGYGRVGDADRALTVPATPLRVDGPTGFDPSRTDFSLSDVLAWARTKPADEEYNYTCNGHCAVAQFLSETGRADDPMVDPGGWSNGLFGTRHAYPRELDKAAIGNGDAYAPEVIETFGAFADRLEQALAR